MPHVSIARVEEALGTGFAWQANTTDANKILLIWYDGPYKYAKVTIAATTITGKADDTNGATTAAPWGTSGVITFTTFGSAPATLAEVANEINTYNGSGWHCDILGALSTKATASGCFITASATSCLKQDGGYALLGDTSGILVAGLKVTNLANPMMNDVGAVHAISSVTWNTTHSAGTMTGAIYVCSGASDGGVPTSETLVYSAGTITSTTALTKDTNDFGGDWPIRTEPGDQILIVATGGTTVTAGYIGCLYSSVGGSVRRQYRDAR
jgi:hypothetical protein